MDRSQSLNAPPYSDGSNYAFWKIRMRAYLCSIDESVWDANNKALNAIFCVVSPDKFHRISHITVSKEAWEILETTYEGMKKVKDTKLQMLTTQF